MTATFYVGDAIKVMGKLPEKSVDLVLTSPPFLALRSYLPADHPDKALEGGSQATPGEFIDWLLDVVEACERVLAPHGSLVFELGDTYSGGWIGDSTPIDDRLNSEGGPRIQDRRRTTHVKRNKLRESNLRGWPLPKSLSLIPESFRWAMVYGHNPFTGRRTEPWRLRNVIRWVRPNPPVGALGDKFRCATSELMVFCKSKDRFFDLDAVRTEHSRTNFGNLTPNKVTGSRNDDGKSYYTDSNPAGAPPLDWWNIPLLDGEEPTKGGKPAPKAHGTTSTFTHSTGETRTGRVLENTGSHPAGAPPLDWWNIPPGGYPGAHYACVDDMTEALTPSGWRPHHLLIDGDLIAVYDRDAGTIGWQPATFHRYKFDGELVAIEKRETSQRLTPNHRVIYKTRDDVEHVTTAADLKPSHRLPVAAPFDIADTAAPSVDMAALFGWFVTEGGMGVNTARIWQSETANPDHCQEIRRLLKAVGADFTESSRLRANTFSPRMWIEMSWVIRGDIARQLLTYGKRLRAESAFWPEPQAQALFDAMVDGDGHRRPDGRISFVTWDRVTADTFQALVARLGQRSTIHVREAGYEVTVGQRTWLSLRGTNGAHDPIGTEHYKGIVWCPSVPSSFWLARRNGRPFITGNTWPPELLIKPIKAMCPEKVCRQCGEPSRRIVETNYEPTDSRQANVNGAPGRYPTGGVASVGGLNRLRSNPTTLGFSDCGHDDWRPGLVLDPFGGSGTTGLVATGHGRDAILIDLDARNFALAQDRIGPFLIDGPHYVTSPADAPLNALPESGRPGSPVDRLASHG